MSMKLHNALLKHYIGVMLDVLIIMMDDATSVESSARTMAHFW